MKASAAFLMTSGGVSSIAASSISGVVRRFEDQSDCTHGNGRPPGDIPRRQVLDRAFASRDLSIKGVIETNSLAIIISLLTTTDRLSMLTTRSVAFDQQGALAILPVIPADLSARRVGLIYRADWLPTDFQNAALDYVRRFSQSAPHGD